MAAELGSRAHTALAELLHAQAVSSPAEERSLILAARAAALVVSSLWSAVRAASSVSWPATFDPTAMRTASRQVRFTPTWAVDLRPSGRTGNRPSLRCAPPELLAPQLVRTNPFVRETVTDLMRRVRGDAIDRELRGMAYRMGLAAS